MFMKFVFIFSFKIENMHICFHIWNIENFISFIKFAPVCSYRIYRKLYLHVWNNPLTWASIPFLEPQQAVFMGGLWWGWISPSGCYSVTQTVKCLSTMWETQVRPLGWEDFLAKEMATHSSTSCLENPMDGGAWCRLLSMGSQKSQAWLSDFTFFIFLFFPSEKSL